MLLSSFITAPAATEFFTLSLHDALPICGCALLVHDSNNSLADARGRERLLQVVVAEWKRGDGGLEGLGILRREGPEGMLHTVGQLAEHVARDILRSLRHKEDAHAL